MPSCPRHPRNRIVDHVPLRVKNTLKSGKVVDEERLVGACRTCVNRLSSVKEQADAVLESLEATIEEMVKARVDATLKAKYGVGGQKAG